MYVYVRIWLSMSSILPWLQQYMYVFPLRTVSIYLYMNEFLSEIHTYTSSSIWTYFQQYIWLYFCMYFQQYSLSYFWESDCIYCSISDCIYCSISDRISGCIPIKNACTYNLHFYPIPCPFLQHARMQMCQYLHSDALPLQGIQTSAKRRCSIRTIPGASAVDIPGASAEVTEPGSSGKRTAVQAALPDRSNYEGKNCRQAAVEFHLGVGTLHRYL